MKGLRLLTVLAVLLLVATGCQQSGQQDESAGGAGTEGRAAQGGTLTVAAPEGIPQLDPHKIVFNIETALYPLLWNGLTQYTQDGGAEVQPDLAESWEASEDATTWTFHLRSGVKFADGKDLSAEDIVASIERAKSPRIGLYLATYIQNIKSVKAVNDETVRIDLDGPSATFPADISRIKIVDLESLETINETPNSTGPFKVKEFVPDDHLVVVRNDNYYGEAPSLDEIKFVATLDPAAGVTGMRSGDFDAMWRAPWNDIAQFQSDPSGDFDVVVAEQSPPTAVTLQFDDQSPPFDKIEARQAMMYAVDRQKILEAVYSGNGQFGQTNSLIAPDDPFFGGDSAQYEFDLDRAKELFAEAGVEEGTTLTYWTTGAYPDHIQMGQLLQEDLAKIGIELQIQENEVNTWAEKFYPPPKTYPGLVVPNLQTFSSPQILGFWKSDVAETNWGNETYDKYVNQGDSELDETARKEAYSNAQDLFSEEVPAIVVLKTSNPVVVSDKVQGVWIDVEGYARFADANFSE